MSQNEEEEDINEYMEEQSQESSSDSETLTYVSAEDKNVPSKMNVMGNLCKQIAEEHDRHEEQEEVKESEMMRRINLAMRRVLLEDKPELFIDNEATNKHS